MDENKIEIGAEITPEQDLGNFKAYLETFKQKLFRRGDPCRCPIACYRAWQQYQAHNLDEKYEPDVYVFTGEQEVDGHIRDNHEWEHRVINEIDRAGGMISGEDVLKIVSLYEGGLL